MGSVHKIRFYPFVLERAEGVRVWDVDGNEYLDMIAARRRTADGQRSSARPARPSATSSTARGRTMLCTLSGPADDRARGASLRDVPRRRSAHGLVRHQRVGRQRLPGQAAAGGHRAPAAHQLRRRLSRPDGRLRRALRPLHPGADHRRRQHHQGARIPTAIAACGAARAGRRALSQCLRLPRGLRARQRLAGGRHRRRSCSRRCSPTAATCRPRRGSCAHCASCATATASGSSSTRSRSAWAAAARCGRSSRAASTADAARGGQAPGRRPAAVRGRRRAGSCSTPTSTTSTRSAARRCRAPRGWRRST